jgi:hypothetical protein
MTSFQSGILLGMSFNPRVELGCSVEEAFQLAKNRYQFMKVFQGKNYFVTAPVKRGKKMSLKILLREGVQPIDLVESYYAALSLAFVAAKYQVRKVNLIILESQTLIPWRRGVGFIRPFDRL